MQTQERADQSDVTESWNLLCMLKRGIIFFLLELNTVKVLLITVLLFNYMFLPYYLHGKTLSVTVQKSPEEPCAGKTSCLLPFSSVWQIGKQTFRRIMPCHPYPCHNHALCPEKTYFFQAMPVSSCLFDGCTQLEIKWFVCSWILKASLKILWL